MHTLKTAAFLILLGAVLYGGYVLLHRPPAQLTHLEESLSSAWNTPTPPALSLEYGGRPVDPAGAPLQPPSFAGISQPPTMAPSTMAPSNMAPSNTIPPNTGYAAEGADSPAREGFPNGDAGQVAADSTRLTPRDPLGGASSEYPIGGPAAFAREQAEAEMAAADRAGPRYPAAAEVAGAVIPTSADSRYGAGEGGTQEETARRQASAFRRDRAEAEELLGANKLPEALELLSKWYDSPDLKADEAIWLVDTLDGLAGTVIYSRQHWFNERKPYRVQRDERLAAIAREFEIPAQLLYNINRPVINDPDLLLPGTELKVVQGPFRAVVHLSGQRLTLFLGEMYAGRFDLTLGGDPLPPAGDYEVIDKQPGSAYFGGPETIALGAPNNPYGKWWMSLGSGYAIHEYNPQAEPAGCLRLAPQDAANVFGILSNGAEVVIRP